MTVKLKELLLKILTTPLVIETGTSGNWTYRKWSDGTAECWANFDDTTSSTQHHFSGTLPITFTAKPSLVASGGNVGNVNSRVAYCSASATSYDIYTIGDWSNTSFVQIYAIGKWR